MSTATTISLSNLSPLQASESPAKDTDVLATSRLADSAVPDGGYGYIVLLGCSVLTFWFVGTSYSWAVLQAALVAQSLSSPSTLSFVGSLWVTCIALLALVNARVIRALGARKTGMLGIG